MKRVRASSMVWRTASTPWTDRYETLAVEGVRSDEVKPRSGWRLELAGRKYSKRLTESPDGTATCSRRPERYPTLATANTMCGPK